MSVVRYVNFVWLVIYEKVEHINKNEQTRYETKVKRNRHVLHSINQVPDVRFRPDPGIRKHGPNSARTW